MQPDALPMTTAYLSTRRSTISTAPSFTPATWARDAAKPSTRRGLRSTTCTVGPYRPEAVQYRPALPPNRHQRPRSDEPSHARNSPRAEGLGRDGSAAPGGGLEHEADEPGRASRPPTTVSVETAARALGLGRTRAYQLARQGQFPCKVVRIGTSYRIVTADLRRLLGIEPS